MPKIGMRMIFVLVDMFRLQVRKIGKTVNAKSIRMAAALQGYEKLKSTFVGIQWRPSPNGWHTRAMARSSHMPKKTVDPMRM